jgi:hypothetical protein
MESEKISQPLAESLRDPHGDDWLDVIVELGAPEVTHDPLVSRAAHISACKEAFARHAGPVVDRIRTLGGEVTDQAWINGSLRARLAKNMVPALSSENLVTRLDLPRGLKADAI